MLGVFGEQEVDRSLSMGQAGLEGHLSSLMVGALCQKWLLGRAGPLLVGEGSW